MTDNTTYFFQKITISNNIDGATPAQAALFTISNTIRKLIEDPRFVESTDATGLLVAKATELFEQAEKASLFPRSEAKDYAYKIMSATSGIRSKQEEAPVDGTMSPSVAYVNRDIIKVILTVLNKVSALKTSVAINGLQKAMRNW